jgi:hypothetical protein
VPAGDVELTSQGIVSREEKLITRLQEGVGERNYGPYTLFIMPFTPFFKDL